MKYQIVHLKAPYETLTDNSLAKYYFSEAIETRIKGYSRYSDVIMPFSGDDFFSDFILIYSNNKPVATYKFVTQETCSKFDYEFPLLSTLLGGKNFKLYNEIKEYLSGKDVGYIGGLTILSNIPKKEVIEIRNIVTASFVHVKNFAEYKEALVTGIIHNKAYKYIMSLGYKKFHAHPVLVSALKSDSYILHLKDHSPSAIKQAEKYAELWNNRIYINRQLGLADQNRQHTHNEELHHKDIESQKLGLAS